MNPVGSAHGLHGSFGESKVAHLPGMHQVCHRADGLFDRHLWIDAMQIVEIDPLHSKTLQRFVAGTACVLRGSIDAAVLNVRVRNDAKLRGKDDTVPPAEQRLAYFDFGIAIYIRRIEKIDAPVECAMNQFDRLDIVLHAAGVHIGDTDAHATQSNRGYLRSMPAEPSLFHYNSLRGQLKTR